MNEKFVTLFNNFIYAFGLYAFFGIFVSLNLRFALFIWTYYCKAGVRWRGGPNTWAVITGATDPVGSEYARQLAEKGYNLMLISFNHAKLTKLKYEIRDKFYDCRIKVLAADFRRSDVYHYISTEVQKLDDIHVLVNNISLGYPMGRPEFFLRIPELNKFISSIINVNIVACTKMTAMVLPGMVTKGSGVVINTSSISALSPTPLIALYSASKVFVDYFSRALSEEYRNRGIVVQSLIPGFVRTTRKSGRMWTECFAPKTRNYVRNGLKIVGKVDSTTGYLGHKYVQFFWTTFKFWSEILGVDLAVKVLFFLNCQIRKYFPYVANRNVFNFS